MLALGTWELGVVSPHKNNVGGMFGGRLSFKFRSTVLRYNPTMQSGSNFLFDVDEKSIGLCD